MDSSVRGIHGEDISSNTVTAAFPKTVVYRSRNALVADSLQDIPNNYTTVCYDISESMALISSLSKIEVREQFLRPCQNCRNLGAYEIAEGLSVFFRSSSDIFFR